MMHGQETLAALRQILAGDHMMGDCGRCHCDDCKRAWLVIDQIDAEVKRSKDTDDAIKRVESSGVLHSHGASRSLRRMPKGRANK